MATPTTQITIDPYSSTTGAGTLGYYANKYGTTVDSLLKVNPDIKDPNMIMAGANLNIPTFTQPSVMTSAKAKTAVDNASKYIDSQTSSATATPPTTTTTPPATPNTTTTPPATTSATPTNPDIANINSTYDTYAKNLQTQVSSLTAGLDSDTAAMIQRLSDTYAQRIREQQDLNARYVGAVGVSGIASGRSRYAPEIQDAILTKEEQNGLQRIADLERERDDLIAKAKTARDEKSRAALMDYQSQLMEINKQKNQAVKDLFQQSQSIEQLNLDKSKEARASIKDKIDNSMTSAKNLAGSIVEYMDSNNLSKADRDKLVTEYADSYGINEDYLRTAVANYRTEVSKADPAIIQEYKYMVDNYGYKGSPLDYQRTKKAALTVNSNSSGNVFTAQDASKFDLPVELVGKTDKEVIIDLSLNKVPDWFKNSQVRAGHITPDAPASEFKSQWDKFRGSPDMLIFRNTIDINKAGKDNTKTSDQIAEDLLNNL